MIELKTRFIKFDSKSKSATDAGGVYLASNSDIFNSLYLYGRVSKQSLYATRVFSWRYDSCFRRCDRFVKFKIFAKIIAKPWTYYVPIGKTRERFWIESTVGKILKDYNSRLVQLNRRYSIDLFHTSDRYNEQQRTILVLKFLIKLKENKPSMKRLRKAKRINTDGTN